MGNKVMKVVLLEDNKLERDTFLSHVNERNDAIIVGVTDSDIEALEMIQSKKPDAIILDLELTHGSGNPNSLSLLENMQHLDLDYIPKIVVTTVVSSQSIYDYVHTHGVDLIFYKKQLNYSPKYVMDTLLLLHDYPTTKTNIVTLSGIKNIDTILSEKINYELNLIGVGIHLQGRKYLHDAILFIIKQEQEKDNITVVQHLMSKYKRSSSTISRAMQNAILHAWRISSLEDLEKHYTAKINYETGLPTPTEFIYYYADKIKKTI